MVQTRVTEYLSQSQSESLQDDDPAPSDEHNVTPGQPAPKTYGKSKKSRRYIKNQKKRTKKREKILHGSSGNKGPQTTSTTRIDDENASILLTERSLTEMLASDTPQPSLSSSPIHRQSDITNGNANDKIVLLESRLLASSISLEGQTLENERLKNAIELIEKEVDSMKKTDKSQKNEIKKLKNENDDLRRQISRFRGMRKFVAVDNKSVGTDSTEANICDTDVKDELNIANAKLHSLHEHLMNITTSMVSALEDEDGTFQQVTRRRATKGNAHHSNEANTAQNRQNKTYSSVTAQGNRNDNCVSAMTSSTGQKSAAPPCSTGPRATAVPAGTTNPHSGQPIPVVTLGLHKQQHSWTTIDHHDAALLSSKQTEEGESIMIGSSLVKDIGGRLNKLGTNASCYVYKGATIPLLRSRVPHIIKDKKTKNVTLLCGGNDCERHPIEQVTNEYEKLISTVRAQCGPNTPILLCKVPPRGNNPHNRHTIDQLNAYIERRTAQNDCVYAVDVCPQSHVLFAKDKVHFNSKGKHYVAKKLAGQMTNFRCHHPSVQAEWMC